MRILLVHPGPAFSVEDVHRGWLKGLREAGAEVIEYDFSSRLFMWQNAHLKRDGEFLQAVPFEEAVKLALEPVGTWIYECQPDVVWFISGFWLTYAFLDTIRGRGQHVLLHCTESPYEDERQIGQAAHADTVLINDPLNLERFKAQCGRTLYVPHSYDPDVHHPGSSTVEESDLCIAGTGYGRRVDWLEQMDLDGYEIALLGNWQSLDEHPLAKWVRAERLDECCDNTIVADWYRNTKASLNIYRDSIGEAMGPREVELAACGRFFLTEPRPENLEVFPYIPKVEGPQDASEQLRWWIEHPYERHEIEARALAEISSWTFTHRARQILQSLT